MNKSQTVDKYLKENNVKLTFGAKSVVMITDNFLNKTFLDKSDDAVKAREGFENKVKTSCKFKDFKVNAMELFLEDKSYLMNFFGTDENKEMANITYGLPKEYVEEINKLFGDAKVKDYKILYDRLLKNITAENLQDIEKIGNSEDMENVTEIELDSHNEMKIDGVSEVYSDGEKNFFYIDVLSVDQSGRKYSRKMRVDTDCHKNPQESYQDYLTGNCDCDLVKKTEILFEKGNYVFELPILSK